MLKVKNGFTLVELVVVITIVSILSTIGYSSYGGFAAKGRDSKRTSDVQSVSQGLLAMKTAAARLPRPDGNVSITWSGAIAWREGKFASESVRALKSSAKIGLSDIPLDPSTGLAYPYAITEVGTEFELLTTLEAWSIGYSYTDTAFAESSRGTYMLKGNYNGLFLRASTWSLQYYLAVPSLIIDPKITEIGIWSVAAYAPSHSGFVLHGQGAGTYHPYDPVVAFSGNVNTGLAKSTLAINLANAYSWSNVPDAIKELEAIKSLRDSVSNRNDNMQLAILMDSVIGTPSSIASRENADLAGWSSCSLSGGTVMNGETVTAYSEESIAWNAGYACTDRASSRTCLGWTLSGNPLHKYPSCTKGVPSDCNGGTLTASGHTYSVPTVLHGTTYSTPTLSSPIGENHGTFRYTLVSFQCNDGVRTSITEQPLPSLISCDSWYGASGNSCVLIPWSPGTAIPAGSTQTSITWAWWNVAWTTLYQFSKDNWSSYSDVGAWNTYVESAGITCGNSYTRLVRACNAGVCWSPTTLSGNSAGCTCTLPWGWSISNGSSTTAYSASSATSPTTCWSISQTRTCTNGVLSGTYTYQNCSQAYRSCNLPWGWSIPHGSSATAYASASVSCGSSCSSQARTCNDGSLWGSYTSQFCSVSACASCWLSWYGTLSHGQGINSYNASSVACGSSCTQSYISCNNGSLSGGSSYIGSCSVASCCACAVWSPCTKCRAVASRYTTNSCSTLYAWGYALYWSATGPSYCGSTGIWWDPYNVCAITNGTQYIMQTKEITSWTYDCNCNCN